jgi:hypothetical protein
MMAHPDYGAPLGGRPYTVDGATFRPYRTGISRYTRVDDSFRVEIWPAGAIGSIFRARVDGEFLPTRYRKFETAARAGLAKAAGK